MASDLARTVGRQIRARRLAAGMRTQRELAEKMPSPTIGNQTISDWERGVHQPSDEYLRELADALNCQVADFFTEPEERDATPDMLSELADGDQLDRIEQRLTDLDEQVRLLRASLAIHDAEELQRTAEAATPTRAPRRQQRR